MRTVHTAAHLWDGARLQDNAIIVVEDGRIIELGSRWASEAPPGANIHDYPGAVLAPAFFDVHFHGAAGHDVMEGTPEALSCVGRFVASRGTGAFLATTVSASVDATMKSLEGLAKIIAQPPAEGEARPIGIHLEGPFLSHRKRGAHPMDRLLAPDIGVFDRLFEAAEGNVRLMTLAPELPGAVELAAHATARGVRISLGHSDANAAETRKAIAAGARSATHTYNAMRALDHKAPGILETVLTSDELYAELICDGIHNMPELVRLWWRAKGPEKAILVTDAMSATGMPDGEYQLGDFSVTVANGRALIGNTLAGSVLTLDKALANFVCFTGATVEQALRLMTVNPAAMTGFGERGLLTVGGPADFVAVDEKGRLLASIVGGAKADRFQGLPSQVSESRPGHP